MSYQEVKADPACLQRMSTALRSSTGELEGMANSVPPMPQVTSSGERVSHALGEALKAAAALIEAVHDTADKIHASDGSYGETDNQAEVTIRRPGTGLN